MYEMFAILNYKWRIKYAEEIGTVDKLDGI